MKTQKNKINIKIDKNSIQDKGEGLVLFPGGLTITDDSVQWNKTKYDIKSMDIDQWNKKITADHKDSITAILGNAINPRKRINRVTIDGIQFAVKENALAQFAYDMMVSDQGPFITDFSIETIGPWPDEDNVYRNSSLVGLSAVVTGNNKSARTNGFDEIAKNSLEASKKNGLDTSYIEEHILCYNNNSKDDIKNLDNKVMFKTVKNTRDFAVIVKYKNAAGDEVEKELKAGETVDVSEDQEAGVKNTIDNAKKPEANVDEIVANKVKDAVSPLVDEIKTLKQQIFDNGAKEPEFTFNGAQNQNQRSTSITKELEQMDYKERHLIQIQAALEMKNGANSIAVRKLSEINQYHLEKLQEAKKVPYRNPVTKNVITLGDFGNFVISPELLTDIQGFRSDYQPLLAATDWRETLSLQMAWLNRTGDIDMRRVEKCDDGLDGNLKPISEYGAEIKTKDMEELAAVTPVCNAATRFLAVDLLGDVAEGYRNDYDRKRAQLIIARMQQAVNETGDTVQYATTSDTNALKSLVNTLKPLAERVMGGTFVFNYSTYWELVSRIIGAGMAGPLAGIFTTGDQAALLGRPYIIVPDDLMPTLNTATTKTFEIDGSNVTINKAIFYGDLRTFTGRTSGGLQYDLSTDAAYEVGGEVRSAYQRNELVLRGSFFRNGVIKDITRIAAMGAPGFS